MRTINFHDRFFNSFFQSHKSEFLIKFLYKSCLMKINDREKIKKFVVPISNCIPKQVIKVIKVFNLDKMITKILYFTNSSFNNFIIRIISHRKIQV